MVRNGRSFAARIYAITGLYNAIQTTSAGRWAPTQRVQGVDGPLEFFCTGFLAPTILGTSK